MKTLRGISPVVATALLILIAIATSALLYLWVSGTVTNTPEEPALNEKIKIEAVKYNESSGVLTAYVRNVGSLTVNVTSIYVIDSTTGSVVAADTGLKVQIEPGNTGTVEVNITKAGATLEIGKPYIVKVVTKNGVEASYVFVRRG